MQNDIEVKILLNKGGEEPLEFNGTCCLRAYPHDGLYWHKNLKKKLAKLSTVQDLLSLINSYYGVELFADSNDMILKDFDEVIIEELNCGDFSCFELESIADDFDPNNPMKVVFAYNFTTDREKKRKIYVIDEDENLIDVSSML